MKTIIKIKLITIIVCSSCNLYGIKSTELDKHAEPLALKQECVQWKRNVTSYENYKDTLDKRLKNIQDQKRRNALLQEIESYEHKIQNIQHNYDRECKKYE